KTATFMRGTGCAYCNHTGYRGRKGIFELLRMSNTMREMTFKREPAQNIRRQARLLGMRTLLEDGVQKALKGQTTLEQLLEPGHRADGRAGAAPRAAVSRVPHSAGTTSDVPAGLPSGRVRGRDRSQRRGRPPPGYGSRCPLARPPVTREETDPVRIL